MIEAVVSLHSWLSVATAVAVAIILGIIAVYMARHDLIKTAVVIALCAIAMLTSTPAIHEYRQQCSIEYIDDELLINPTMYNGVNIPADKIQQIIITERNWWSGYVSVAGPDDVSINFWVYKTLLSSILKMADSYTIPVMANGRVRGEPGQIAGAVDEFGETVKQTERQVKSWVRIVEDFSGMFGDFNYIFEGIWGVFDTIDGVMY